MLIYGKNVAIETLNDNKKILKAYISDTFHESEIINELHRNNIKIVKTTKYDMDKKVSGLHQGVILEVPDYKYASLDELNNMTDPLVVMLDHIEDPHNFGAIIRTCEAAGVDAIIIPDDRSVEVNGTVVKTSVGTIDRVKIIKVKNLVNTIKSLKKNGFWIFGTDMQGEDYSKLDYRGKTIIICGNEGSGMSRLVKENCDFIASIPMKGNVNSLNASVATGIIIFEAVKIRGI